MEVSERLINESPLTQELKDEAMRYMESVHRMEGLDWLFVMAVDPADMDIHAQVSLAELAEIKEQAWRQKFLVIPIAILMSIVCSYPAGWPLFKSLKLMASRLKDLERLDFSHGFQMQPVIHELLIVSRSFSRMKDFIAVMSKYVPPALISLLGEKKRRNEDSLNAGQLCLEAQTCSTLCCTITTFTQIAGHKSSQEVVLLLGLYIRAFEEAVKAREGQFTDFMNDRAIAFWPSTLPDHAVRAHDAAQSILASTQELLARFAIEEERQENVLMVSIGLHFGPSWVGNFGTEEQMKYGCVGESVDIAFRLCALAKTYQAHGLMSSTIASLIPGVSTSEAIGSLSYQGVVAREDVDFFAIHHHSDSGGNSTTSPVPADSESARQLVSSIIQSSELKPQAQPASPISETHKDGSCWSQSSPYVKFLKEHVLRAPVLLISLCSLQILLAVMIVSYVNDSNHQKAEILVDSVLNQTVEEVTTRISTLFLADTIHYTQSALSELPKCAELVAADFRLGKLHTSRPKQIATALTSFSSHFSFLGAKFGGSILIGTRENKVMIAAYPSYGAKKKSKLRSYGSNLHNEFPNNITKYTDSSRITYEFNDIGEPLLETATLQWEGYNSRLRPWYQSPRRNMAPSAVGPYIWGFQSEGLATLALDLCVPVYDNATKQKFDHDWTATNVWDESLATVACCETSLSDIGYVLSTIKLGKRGFVYIVETQGEDAGKLIAASTEGNQLRTAFPSYKTDNLQEVPLDDFVQINAVNYPIEDHPLIANVTQLLLSTSGGSWSDLDSVAFLDVNFGTSEDDRLIVRSAALDGEEGVPNWNVGPEGGWSTTPYRYKDLHWRVVVAVYPRDIITVAEVIEQNRENVQVMRTIRINVSVGVFVLAVILAALVAQQVQRQLFGLKRQMDGVLTFDFEKRKVFLSNFREIQEVQLSFENLRLSLERLQRYTSDEVVRIFRNERVAKSLNLAKPGMTERFCCVLCSCIVNFKEIEQACGAGIEILRVMDRYIEMSKRIIKEEGGVLNDFDGSEVSAYWQINTERDHAIRACRAANKIQDAVRKLNRSWLQYGMRQSVDLKCTFGVQCGECYVGSYGSTRRLKYGCVGQTVETAQRLATLAKSLKAGILLHEDAREQVHGTFVCAFKASVEIGKLYEIQIRTRRTSLDTVDGSVHSGQPPHPGIGFRGRVATLIRLRSADSESSKDPQGSASSLSRGRPGSNSSRSPEPSANQSDSFWAIGGTALRRAAVKALKGSPRSSSKSRSRSNSPSRKVRGWDNSSNTSSPRKNSVLSHGAGTVREATCSPKAIRHQAPTRPSRLSADNLPGFDGRIPQNPRLTAQPIVRHQYDSAMREVKVPLSRDGRLDQILSAHSASPHSQYLGGNEQDITCAV